MAHGGRASQRALWEVAHGGRAKGEMGRGHQKAVWEQQKVHWSLKNITTGLIWLVEAWGGGPWRAGKGGGTREQ